MKDIQIKSITLKGGTSGAPGGATEDDSIRAYFVGLTSEGRLSEHHAYLVKVQSSPAALARLEEHPALAKAFEDFRKRLEIAERSAVVGGERLHAELNRTDAARNYLALTATKLRAALDPDRLRGAKVKKAARDGGDIRRGQTAPETAQKLAELARLIEKGHTITSAAAALERNQGYGTKGSLRKLWHRHRK